MESHRSREERRREGDVFETAFITDEVWQALRRSESLSRTVREQLYDCLKLYRSVDVASDGIFRVTACLARVLRTLQSSTGLPLLWHERPGAACYPDGVVDAGVTRPALGRLYFRMAVDGQGTACACAHRGKSYASRRGCFCSQLLDLFRPRETVGSERELGLACAQYFQFWSARQLATVYAWASLRTLALLSQLVRYETVTDVFDEGALVLAEKVMEMMETNRHCVVVFRRRRRR